MGAAYKLKNKDKNHFIVAPGVWSLKTLMVNVYFVEGPAGSWVLVDTGIYGYTHKIKQMAEDLFGENSRPAAILLTHGHFDHVGTVKELAEYWNVPVYAHPLEFPYLTGKSSYPPPDPSVGGGAMAFMSFMYPKKPINIQSHLKLLPEDGSIPTLPGWHWIFTPGHSPGHVSYFRKADRTLIAGDAFVTRDGESAIAVMTQKREVHGPPAYYTPDWGSAHRSVEKLSDLAPEIAATGHGMPMYGEDLRRQLRNLVQNFWIDAVPNRGRYVNERAVTDEFGVVYVPEPVDITLPKVLTVVGAVAVATLTWTALRKRNKKVGDKQLLSHNRVAPGTPPAVNPNYDDPTAHTNNYP